MPSRALCAYKGCMNSKSKRPDLSFHRFSTDLSEDWIIRCGNLALLDLNPVQLSSKRVCSEHFDNSDFFEAVHGNRRLRVLKRTALPIDNTLANEVSKEQNFTTVYLATGQVPIVIDGSNPCANNLQTETIDMTGTVGAAETVGTIETTAITETVDIIENVGMTETVGTTETINITDNIDMIQTFHIMEPNSGSTEGQEIIITTCSEAALNDSEKKCVTIGKSRRGMLPMTRREVRMKARITELEKTVKNQKRVIQRLKSKGEQVNTVLLNKLNNLNDEQLMFLKMQTDHIKRIPWSSEERKFAIDLFYRSPKAYVFLRNEKHFNMPSVSAIQEWVHETNVSKDIS